MVMNRARISELAVFGSSCLFCLVFVFVEVAFAGEIHYGHIEEVQESNVHIQYKGPSGVQNFVCNISTVPPDCESFGTSTPALLPEINGQSDYLDSPDGHYGVIGQTLVDASGAVTYEHVLYDIKRKPAREIAVIPYTGQVTKRKFSWDNQHLVLLGINGEVITYDIQAASVDYIRTDQTSFPLLSLSPQAKYLASYNHTDKSHIIWNTASGEKTEIPGTLPLFVEFSQDERRAAFVDKKRGQQTLYTVNLEPDGRTTMPRRVFKDDFTVEDYLWFENDLYALGNTEDNHYKWVLYRHQISSNNTRVVAENVSYGAYIRPIGDYALSFLVLEGKNSHVALYDAKRDSVRVLRLVEASPMSDGVVRTIMKFSRKAQGILYEPNDADSRLELFVWLHGGPMRQTSFGYHSYLSYAVYDELLERLADSGAYVLKLDYAGSYGHGSVLGEALNNRLGRADVHQVIEATRKIKRKFKVDKVYLIGNSYGGYLAVKTLVDKNKLFDGAIAINGVFDWQSLLERIPTSPFKVYFKKSVYYKNAAIDSALPELSRNHNILLVYGQQDDMVPIWQTQEFFHQVKSLNKNVHLLRLETEGHIIRGRDSLNLICEFIRTKLSIGGLKCT